MTTKAHTDGLSKLISFAITFEMAKKVRGHINREKKIITHDHFPTIARSRHY